MRRALLLIAVFFVLFAPRANAADQTIHIEVGGTVRDPANVSVNGGDSVTWINDDLTDTHSVFITGEGNVSGDIASGGSFSHTFPDPGSEDVSISYHIDSASGPGGTITVKATTTTTAPTSTSTSTTEPTSTTASSTTSSSTTTSTSSTTTTSSSTTTTTRFSSASGQIPIQDKGGSGGGSSALPLLLGAFVVVAGLAGLAYWLWLRSGEPYEDDGPDWTQEPPPTVQGPRI